MKKLKFRWLGKLLTRLALRHMDRNGDGKVDPVEVMQWAWENVLGPAMVAEPGVDMVAADLD